MSLENIRIHPLLPTRDEFSSNPDLMYSDHIPQLLQVNESLRVMTYNVYDINAPCGYDFQHMLNKDEMYQSLLLQANDTPADSDPDYQQKTQAVKTARGNIATRQDEIKQAFNQKRQRRIAEGIRLAVTKQKLDVVLLQEADVQQQNLLQEQLGAQWVAVRENEYNLVTFYNQEKYSHCLIRKLPITTNDYVQALVLTDKLGTKIQVINFHGDGDPEFSDKKEVIDGLFAARQANTLSVIAGDFNTPMNHMAGQVGVTSLVPNQFNYAHIEGEDDPREENRRYEVGMSIDGGLLLKASAPVTKIEKIKPEAIDLSTGDLLPESQLDASKAPAYRQKQLPIYQTEDELTVEAIMKKDIASDSYKNPIQAREAVNTLYQAGLLERGFLGFIRDNKPDNYLKKLAEHSKPLELADAIKECKALGLLRTGIFGWLTGVNGENNLVLLAKSENPKEVIERLKGKGSMSPGRLQRFLINNETLIHNEAAVNEREMTSTVMICSAFAAKASKTDKVAGPTSALENQENSHLKNTSVDENDEAEVLDEGKPQMTGPHN